MNDLDQWRIVEEWRKELLASHPPRARQTIDAVSDGGDGNPALARLETEWKQALEGRVGPDWLNDRAHQEKVSTNLLSALAVYTDLGAYPPPELLLGIAEQYYRYIEARGSATAEEAFFGKPVRKAGNYAKRTATRRREMALVSYFFSIKKDGESDIATAERLVESMGLSEDANDLLRKLRKHWKRDGALAGK